MNGIDAQHLGGLPGGTSPADATLRPGSARSGALRSQRVVPFVAVVGLHAVVLAVFLLVHEDPPVAPPVPVETSIIQESHPPPAPPHLRPPTLTPTPRAIQVPVPLVTIASPSPVAATVQPAPPPAPAVEAVVAGAGKAPPEPVAPPRFDADYLHNPPPVYPPQSRRLHEQGTTLLRVLVSKDGNALQVSVEHSSGSHRLDEAAQDAVARWRFAPARRGAEAVEAWVLVPIEFELHH